MSVNCSINQYYYYNDENQNCDIGDDDNSDCKVQGRDGSENVA